MEFMEPGAQLKGDYTEMPLFVVVHNVKLGNGVIIRPYCNLYGCEIGDDTKVGAYTEIGTGVKVGKRCKIGARTFIPPGVTISDEVFIGPGVTFTNDRYPRATGDWECLSTTVYSGASIGAGVTVLPGVAIGAGAMIGAGSVVLRDVAAGETYYNKRT